MKRNAIIGVVQDNGRILTARVRDTMDLKDRLTRSYASRLRATMLVTLGDIVEVGPTPGTSTLGADPEPVMVADACAFEALHESGATRFHLFDSGSWVHWADEDATGPALLIEVE